MLPSHQEASILIVCIHNTHYLLSLQGGAHLSRHVSDVNSELTAERTGVHTLTLVPLYLLRNCPISCSVFFIFKNQQVFLNEWIRRRFWLHWFRSEPLHVDSNTALKWLEEAED